MDCLLYEGLVMLDKVGLGDIGNLVRHTNGTITVESHHGFSRRLSNPEIERIITLLTAKPDEVNISPDEQTLKYCTYRSNRKGVYDSYRYDILNKTIGSSIEWKDVFITATVCDTIYVGIKRWQLPLYLLKAAFFNKLEQCDRFIKSYHTESNLKRFFRMNYFSQCDTNELDIDTAWLDVPITVIMVHGKMKLDLLNPDTISYLNKHVYHKYSLKTNLLTPELR